MIKYKKYKLKIKELKMYKNFYKNSKSNKGGISWKGLYNELKSFGVYI